MNTFPEVPVCVEAILDKPMEKITLCMAIPVGVKSLVWFSPEYCYILTLSKDGKSFDNVTIDNSFSYINIGTVLYGTLYYIEERPHVYFTMEDIYLYNYKNTSQLPMETKMALCRDMLRNEIQPFDLYTSSFIIGFPFMRTNWKEMYDLLPHISYKIHSIRFHFEEEKDYSQQFATNIHTYFYYPLNRKTNDVNVNDLQAERMETFYVKADPTMDIYHLFSEDEKVYIGIASVQTLKTSLFLGSLFRNMKMDYELDELEESDGEEDGISKKILVDTELKLKMICVYNIRFKKWCPLSLA
jgi:hypothetical protein